jgi:hypothetical protein
VVDTEDLVRGEDLLDGRVELLGRLEVVAEGLLDDRMTTGKADGGTER